MEKITKKEFLETLTENPSTLIWNTRNITEETVENKLDNLHLDGVILEKRTATARATFVEFTGADVVRHPLVKDIVAAYDKWDKKTKKETK